jgi:hypothetical protein
MEKEPLEIRDWSSKMPPKHLRSLCLECAGPTCIDSQERGRNFGQSTGHELRTEYVPFSFTLKLGAHPSHLGLYLVSAIYEIYEHGHKTEVSSKVAIETSKLPFNVMKLLLSVMPPSSSKLL